MGERDRNRRYSTRVVKFDELMLAPRIISYEKRDGKSPKKEKNQRKKAETKSIGWQYLSGISERPRTA